MGQVQVVMTGDEARLFKSLAKVIAQEQKMAAGFGEVKKKAKDASSEMEKSFGSQAVSQIGKWAAGFATGATAVGLMTQALQDMRQELSQAGGDMKKLLDTNITLNQVANDAKDLSRFQARRDELARRYGMDPAEVASLLFNARSEGFEPLVEKIIAARQVVPPREAAIVAGQVPTLFKGQITGEQALNATLKAAGISRLDFAPMAQALPKAAEGAAPAGSSPAEVMALASVFASSFASGDTMSDRLKAFGARLSIDDRFRGKGIMGGFEALRGMDKDEREEFLGKSQELNAVYFLLEQNAAQVRTVQRQVEEAIAATGTNQSEMAKGIARAQANPELRAAMASDRAEVALEVSRRAGIGEIAMSSEATRNAVIADMYQRGRSRPEISAARMATSLTEGLTGNQMAIRAAAVAGPGAAFGATPGAVTDAIRLLADAANALRAATGMQQAAANRPSRTPPQPSRRAAQLQERNAQRE